MGLSDLHILPTPYLQKRRKLGRFALLFVWMGASLAILASLYQFTASAAFPLETFASSVIALLASIPVFLEKQRIEQILLERTKK